MVGKSKLYCLPDAYLGHWFSPIFDILYDARDVFGEYLRGNTGNPIPKFSALNDGNLNLKVHPIPGSRDIPDENH